MQSKAAQAEKRSSRAQTLAAPLAERRAASANAAARATPMQDASAILLSGGGLYGGQAPLGRGAVDAFAAAPHALAAPPRHSGFGSAFTPGHDGRQGMASAPPRNALSQGRPLWYAGGVHAAAAGAPSLHAERERSAMTARRFGTQVW